MNQDDLQAEKDCLKNFDSAVCKHPSTAVDTAIFTVINNELKVLLVKRSEHPFKNYWSLLGGYVDLDQDSDLEETARRKLFEKTAVRTPYLEQYKTIGNKTRDPRGWSITTAYFALIPSHNIVLSAGSGAQEIQWSTIHNGKILEQLSFDHQDILQGCLERLRNKVLYTSLPAYLLDETFTMGELKKVYEIILDKKIDRKSFHRRLLNADILDETGQMHHSGTKPSKLYRLKDADKLHYFIRNFEGSTNGVKS